MRLLAAFLANMKLAWMWIENQRGSVQNARGNHGSPTDDARLLATAPKAGDQARTIGSNGKAMQAHMCALSHHS